MSQLRPESDLATAQTAWQRLSYDEKLEAVRCAARAFTAKTKKRLGTGVTGVGFGGRKKRTATRGAHGSRRVRVFERQPCLIVFVEEKRSKSNFGSARLVPPQVIIDLPDARGESVAVAVPTDVVTKPRRPRAQAFDGVYVENFQDDLRAYGSVAAIVRDEPDSGERYLLTCHHVACLSGGDPLLQARLPTDTFSVPGFALVGDEVREAYFGAGVGPCIDAAVVRIEDASSTGDLSPPFPTSTAIQSSAELVHEFATGARLFSYHNPNGRRVRFQQTIVDCEVQYESGAVATIVEAIEYRFSSGSTAGGDSGGALISRNGVFLGMHIAGSGAIGYGIPAYLLFDSPAFQPPIQIA
jgi:hypothetical protein